MPSTVIVQAPSAQAPLLVSTSNSVISRVYGAASADVTAHHLPVAVIPAPVLLQQKRKEQEEATAGDAGKKQRTESQQQQQQQSEPKQEA